MFSNQHTEIAHTQRRQTGRRHGILLRLALLPSRTMSMRRVVRMTGSRSDSSRLSSQTGKGRYAMFVTLAALSATLVVSPSLARHVQASTRAAAASPSCQRVPPPICPRGCKVGNTLCVTRSEGIFKPQVRIITTQHLHHRNPQEHEPVSFQVPRGPARTAHPGRPTLIRGATQVRPHSAALVDRLEMSRPARVHAAGPTDPLQPWLVTDLRKSGADVGPGNAGWETSGARGGNVVFYTWNWGEGYSIDGGRTFHAVNLFDMSPGGMFADIASTGEVPCCDQQVIYVPSIDRFVWIAQTLPGTNGENRYRIAVASPERIRALDARGWVTWDITPSSISGFGGKHWWFDFPDVTVTSRGLLLSFNIVAPDAGAAVLRLPLAALRDGTTAHGYGWHFWNGSWIRLAQSDTQRPVVYFAFRSSTSSITAGRWFDDNPGGGLFANDLAVSSASDHVDEKLPGGGVWLDSAGGARVLGAAFDGTGAWFAWHSGDDSRFKRTHIEILRVDSSLLHPSEQYVWSTDYAFAFPALAANSNHEVGMAFEWGGGRWGVHSGVAFLSNRQDYVNVSTPGTDGGGGHYMTLRRNWPDTRQFAASVHFCTTGFCRPQFVIFGRSTDFFQS